ncbi:MAG: ATP-dependent nuclease [Ginsengibacter sp.]
MARVRDVVIHNFRCIRRLHWMPSPGINALVGPGDAGKSTILEAIDYCLAARRTIAFTDADFYKLDATQAIKIAITLGDLPESLLDLDVYGLFLRGFDATTGTIIDEPGRDCETALTIELTVDASLEPTWLLHSERAAAIDQQRSLTWTQRVALSPIRIGPGAAYHLAWRHGSLLSRLTRDLPDASMALATAAREARRSFGDQAGVELHATLMDLFAEATRLGIQVGNELKAMLDAESVSLGRGTISLHTSDGVPLQCLGSGSLRLLVAALQQRLADESSIILVDELEHGLEPHRILQLLVELGSKANLPTSQVFLTTHSPVAVRELSSQTLFVLRTSDDGDHTCAAVGSSDQVQGTVRTFPEALLSRVIVVCEGASEVGLLRGLDQHDYDNGYPTLAAVGVVGIDGGGDSRVVGRARALASLGFRTAILRDNDNGAPVGESDYEAAGGRVFCWRPGHALEDELFAELSDNAVHQLIEMAVDKIGAPTADAHIKSASNGSLGLEQCRGSLTPVHREALGRAAKSKSGTWFKSVSDMERVARDVIAPGLTESGAPLKDVVQSLRVWAREVAS